MTEQERDRLNTDTLIEKEARWSDRQSFRTTLRQIQEAPERSDEDRKPRGGLLIVF